MNVARIEALVCDAGWRSWIFLEAIVGGAMTDVNEDVLREHPWPR